jgi:hypothetical protein
MSWKRRGRDEGMLREMFNLTVVLVLAVRGCIRCKTIIWTLLLLAVRAKFIFLEVRGSTTQCGSARESVFAAWVVLDF